MFNWLKLPQKYTRFDYCKKKNVHQSDYSSTYIFRLTQLICEHCNLYGIMKIFKKKQKSDFLNSIFSPLPYWLNKQWNLLCSTTEFCFVMNLLLLCHHINHNRPELFQQFDRTKARWQMTFLINTPINVIQHNVLWCKWKISCHLTMKTASHSFMLERNINIYDLIVITIGCVIAGRWEWNTRAWTRCTCV